MSESFCKVNDLLDKNKRKEAAREFASSFFAPMTRFYFEARDVAPARYSKDRGWRSKIGKIYNLAKAANKYLQAGNVKAARKTLDRIRESFYELHIANQMDLTNDAIYAFRSELDKIENGKGPRGNECATLNKLKAKVPKAEPSQKVEADKEKFDKELREWLDAVEKILSDSSSPVHQQVARLQDATEEFYKRYGMHFE